MSEMSSQRNLTIKRCTCAVEGCGSHIRKTIKKEIFFAFKLQSWLMFVEETEPTKPKENAQLDLF